MNLQPEFYVVGGAVRDALLGVRPNDIDYLVVGATPNWMMEQGFVQVGADFPVFLKKGEEYALARTERKSGAGYHGFETTFDPSVTIQDDLMRRDVTINSMAVPLQLWEEFLLFCQTKLRAAFWIEEIEEDLNRLVANWTHDIFAGALIMNSKAFLEDPVRVFRVVRMRHTLPKGKGLIFAEWDEWDYGSRTLTAMKEMVQSEDFNHLTCERIVQEIVKTASKCRTAEAFKGFLDDLDEISALQHVVANEYDRDTQLEDVGFPDGISEREAVAIMQLCDKKGFLSQHELHVAKFSNEAVKFAQACTVIATSHSVRDEKLTAEEILTCFEGCHRNIFTDAGDFLVAFGIITDYDYERLKFAFTATIIIGMDSLTVEQQNNLKGREIGAAIRKNRVEYIDKLIKIRYD